MEQQEKLNKWGSTTVQIDKGESIPVGANCYGWKAVNKGDGTVVVDGQELKGYVTGHPEIEGASSADVHPLGWPRTQEWISVKFKNDGTVNRVQITYYNNY